MMDMRRDATVRGGAALVLIAFLVGVVSLYDPLLQQIDFHIALPIGLGLGIVVITAWYQLERRNE